MTKYLKLFVVTLLCSVAFMMVHSAPKAEAKSGTCWFNTTAGPVSGTTGCAVSGNGDFGTNDVLTGRSSTGAGNAINTCAEISNDNPGVNCIRDTNANRKADFISFIENKFYNGGTHDKVGAAFIMQKTRGDRGWPTAADVQDWEDRINNPDVFIDIYAVSIYKTSWYDPGNHNTFSASYSPGNRGSVIIKYRGTVYGVIERGCGNVANDTVPPPKWGPMVAKTVAHDGSSIGPVIANGGSITPGHTIVWVHTVQNQGTYRPAGTSPTITGHVDDSFGSPNNTGADPAFQTRFNAGAYGGPYLRSQATTNTDAGKTFCQRIYGHPTSYQNAGNFYSTSQCIKVKLPVATDVTCSLDVNPGDPDPFTTLTFTLTYTSAAAPNLQFSFMDSGGHQLDFNGSGVAGTDVTKTFTVAVPPGGFAVGNSAALASVSAGGKTATCGSGSATSAGNPTCANGGYCGTIDCGTGSSCTCVVLLLSVACPPPLITPILPEPYLAAYGADVIAGAYPDVGGVCGTNGAGVTSWNHDANSPAFAAGDYGGAGGKAAVFASGNISHFSSGLNITNLKPAGLSFGNTTVATGGEAQVDTAAGNYGGDFGGQLPTGCSFTSGTPVAWPGYNAATMTNFSGHKYYVATGDVYIGSGGIKYASTGGWATLSAIPSFKLVVTGGNIYIDNNAAQLDGLFVAIPSGGSGGEIFTCATAVGVPVDKTSTGYKAACNTQLKIYGAFAAKTIHFDRTYGTVGQTGQTGAPTDFLTDNAAEQFIFGPEMWLPNGSGDGGFDIKYYQGLPPVL